jgi:hypothetical protein
MAPWTQFARVDVFKSSAATTSIRTAMMVLIVGGGTSYSILRQHYYYFSDDHRSPCYNDGEICHCETPPSSLPSSGSDTPSSRAETNRMQMRMIRPPPSQWRVHVCNNNYFWNWHHYLLSGPPRKLARNDPVWSLTRHQKRQREKDEQLQSAILQSIIEYQQNHHSRPASSNEELKQRLQHLAKLQQQWLNVVYGSNVTLKDRQQFLERFGCTGYTEEIIQELLQIAYDRGICEIGAGNGQWARVLSDRFQKELQNHRNNKKKNWEFVLAFDDFTNVPLDPKMYHSKTQPAHDYFYSKVRHVRSVEDTLKQWSCRGRILLLVYPPPASNMAVDAVRSYDKVNPHASHPGIIVYVGEGRGGCNANDAFFDYLENPEHGWIIEKVLQPVSFGSKGYEKMYVFRKIVADNDQ